MSEKKKSTKTSKLKNFLVTGSIEDETEEEEMIEGQESEEEYEAQSESYEDEPFTVETPITEEEMIIEDVVVTAVESEDNSASWTKQTEYELEEEDPVEDRSALLEEIAELKAMVASLTSELGRYTTSKEQLKEYSAQMNKRDAELANRKYMSMLEQLSVMREDFFRLSKGINAKLDSFTPQAILNSFEAYGVDMENILLDCGVFIGQFKYEKLNTIHQRIVDVIPTDDDSLNGMIAERVSDGYEYNGRVLLKEKVKIYKFSEKKEETEKEGDEEI